MLYYPARTLATRLNHKRACAIFNLNKSILNF